MSENVYIPGFGLRGYKSFGNDLQHFGPFKKINLFIGPNNAGKSNVLEFIEDYWTELVNNFSSNPKLSVDDDHLSKSSNKANLDIQLVYSKKKVKERIGYSGKRNENKKKFDVFMNSEPFSFDDDFYKVRFTREKGDQFDVSDAQIDALSKLDLHKGDWQKIVKILKNRTSRNMKDNINKAIDYLNPARWLSKDFDFRVTFIPAIREVDQNSGQDLATGSNIIEHLAEWQHPDHDEMQKKEKFDKVQEFLRVVTEEKNAEIEIPNSKKNINVNMNGRLLPLEALGTGIKEVIILAATATIESDSVICMEEPEVHLHPSLQRKLLGYLYEQTSNQYFIATHSAHLMNFEEASVFHLRLEDNWTEVDRAITDRQKFRISKNLGYRASDILQANCIIWVEGPSDRIYIKEWLDQVAPNIEEGVHYSIMFYGGRLLSHLSVDDPEVEEFIDLTKINQNLCLVMDSDQSKKGEKRKPTKIKIEKQIKAIGGRVWNTYGREMENYIPEETLWKAIKELDSDAKELLSTSQYDKVYRYTTTGKDSLKPKKVKLAREVAKQGMGLKKHDLERQIKSLVEFIEEANQGLLSS